MLWDKDGIAIKDVIKRLKLDSGTLSPIIKRMQTAGLIEKIRTDDDERIVRLFLTQKAKDLEPLVAAIQDKVSCHTGLSAEAFFELLNRLNELNKNLNSNIVEQQTS